MWRAFEKLSEFRYQMRRLGAAKIARLIAATSHSIVFNPCRIDAQHRVDTMSGTWLGWSVIALGLALPMAGWSGASSTMICTRIVTAGIALLIVLPVLRVFLMLVVFVRERDFRFSAIAMLVLSTFCQAHWRSSLMYGKRTWPRP
jgi:hypothetical protein